MSSAQYNFFLDKGETFSEDIFITDEEGPVNLTGHTITFKTSDETIAGVVNGNVVTFTKASGFDEDTKYIIDNLTPNGDYKWILYGTVKVRSWL